ncbi:SirB2 family protein [Chitinimonas sp. JJ19]|uniref:SirB2 family protein n=1 Tax=Chitinimonas sp. JJ19 TaxID=3109352 RepID=UPI003001D6DF
MSYLTLRHLHTTAAFLSVGLFMLRGGLALAGRNWRQVPTLRWLPHVNDTVLLSAAISLAWLSGQYPFQQHWLTAKVIALLAYIATGKMALRPEQDRTRRVCWLLAALACVAYILAVARIRSPWLGLA